MISINLVGENADEIKRQVQELLGISVPKAKPEADTFEPDAAVPEENPKQTKRTRRTKKEEPKSEEEERQAPVEVAEEAEAPEEETAEEAPVEEAPKEEPKTTETPKDLAEMRKVLRAAQKAGLDAHALLEGFGDRLSAVPAERYGELAERVEAAMAEKKGGK